MVGGVNGRSSRPSFNRLAPIEYAVKRKIRAAILSIRQREAAYEVKLKPEPTCKSMSLYNAIGSAGRRLRSAVPSSPELARGGMLALSSRQQAKNARYID